MTMFLLTWIKYSKYLKIAVLLQICLWARHTTSQSPSETQLANGKLLQFRCFLSNSALSRLINLNFYCFRFVPYEVYSDKVYPMYLCGASYVMSSDVAEKLYQCAYSTPIFYIEDIYVTGMCAKKVNVTPQHSSEFYCFHSEKYICLHKHRSIVHYFSPNQIRTSYEILKEKRCPASGSWRVC